VGMLARYLSQGNAFDERLWPGASGQHYATEAGEVVSEESALRVSTVYRAVNVMAAALAVLPVDVFDPLPARGAGVGGKRVVEGDPTRRLLRRRPNRMQTSYRWRHHMAGHVLLGGNYYAQKVRRSPGAPVEQLFPIRPERIRIGEILSDGSPLYVYSPPNGQERKWTSREVLHVRGFSLDGHTGVSVLQLMREHVGQSLASQRQRSNFMRRELRPSVVVTHPKSLSPAAEKNIQAGYQKAQGGPGNAGGVFVLGEEAKLVPFAVSPKDAQWVEGEGFSISDFLRFIGVPGVLVGYADKTATYASAEAFFQSFVTHSLWPLTENIEDELTCSLFDDEGEEERFVEFNLNAMLRADSQARAAFYRAMVELGIMTRNEVRELENRNPLDGLDEPLTPANMSVGGATPSTPAPSKAPTPEEDDDDPPPPEERAPAARAHAIAAAAAGRLIRREVAQLTGGAGKKGLAARYAQDVSGWQRAVREFYAEHAGVVAEALAVPAELAARYCSDQINAVLAPGGLAVVERWPAERVPALVQLALEGRA
jgi:HK97 family phage portal protein